MLILTPGQRLTVIGGEMTHNIAVDRVDLVGACGSRPWTNRTDSEACC